MDVNPQAVAWFIHGVPVDPAEDRNRRHLIAMREASRRPSLAERARAFLGIEIPTARAVDRVCCAA